ncbi:MAG: hypothetical protein M1812_002785 [Candelaria pacifica]|nr:MAG: hypothetical protein M1812_002785 [Candelaria pacifica]
MLISQKRKARWSSNSLFRGRTPSKVVVIERSSGSLRGLTNSPNDAAGVEQYSSQSSVASRLKRGGSRILSIFRLKRSSGSQMTAGSSSSGSYHDTALAIVRDAASSSSSQKTPYGTRHGMKSARPTLAPVDYTSPTAAVVAPLTSTPKAAQSLGKQMDGALEELAQPRITTLFPSRKSSVSSLRQSRSSQGLSHKLSTKFVHPTVVHRPNMRSRPSLASLKTSSDAKSIVDAPLRQTNIQDTTDPSTPSSNSNTMSPVDDPSTGKTSLLSDVVSQRSAEAKERLERSLARAKTLSVVAKEAHEKPLTPIKEVVLSQAPLVTNPSIVTVETTAAAKIFFETHFNRILFGRNTPRSLRRRELELKLQIEPMSSEQRVRERNMWARLESDYLRQSRVQKARSLGQQNDKGINVAGYEVVHVLGKGSFGVVRLVRQKQNAPDNPMTVNSTSQPSLVGQGVSERFSKQDVSGSTNGAKRTSRRRGLDAMKREVFAMKVIRKSDMLRNSQEGHLRAERDFLVASEGSRWVVPLIASFQDSTNLYLVMDYMLGGDFLGLLIRKNTLSEEVTKWYIAEMILCVEEAHKLKWIHRDIKPDNFLISESGHLKISDFGLAFDGHWSHDQAYFNNHRYSLLQKLGIKIEGDTIDRTEGQKNDAKEKMAKVLAAGRERHQKPSDEEDDEVREGIVQWRNRTAQRKLARSIVGTSQYMAPEVVRGELYDARCDWWSIGIILYECLYGHTPFNSENRQQTKEKIHHHSTTLSFPHKEKISLIAIDLMSNLLREKERRLCSNKYRVNDYELQKAASGHHPNVSANRLMKDYGGHYVYPDDAAELKKHPFFHRIKWDRMHLVKPPFVPKVKSWEDTKYFEEEEPISDVSDSSSYSSAREDIAAPGETDGSATTAYAQHPESTWNANEIKTINDVANDKIKAKHARDEKRAARKEKKRPRDMLLRDPEVGKKVLEIRKKGAFMGYTYRRPQGFLWENDEERLGRQVVPERGRLPGVF